MTVLRHTAPRPAVAAVGSPLVSPRVVREPMLTTPPVRTVGLRLIRAAVLCGGLAAAIPSIVTAATVVATDTTQNTGTYANGGGSLTITHATNNPLLTLMGNANTSGVQTVIIGNSTNHEGRLLVSGGSDLLNNSGDGSVYVGLNSSATGTATVTGAGSTWTNTSDLRVGYSGTGVLDVEDQGLVTNLVGYLGENSGSSGTATVTGAVSTWQNNSFLFVGNTGTGVLNVENQGLVTNTIGVLGRNSGSNGTATVTGDGSHWQNTELRVGQSGTGVLNVEAKGLVTNTFGSVGRDSGSSGTATVTGDGSTWANSQGLNVGGNSGAGGTGIVSVLDGGLVSVGTLLKVWNGDTVNLQPGGTISTHDFDFSLGTLNFTGGTLTINGGEVTGLVTVPGGGLVTGTGNFLTGLSLADGGAVSPGFSPETITATTGTWSGGGTYIWEINALATDGGAAGNATGWDLWEYTGPLSVTATSGNPLLVEVHSLDALDMAGDLANFDSGSSYSWLIATAGNDAFSNLLAFAIDATDFQNALGGGSFSLTNGEGGTELYLNFTPFTSTAAVPEPSSLLLALVGGASLLLYRRRSSTARTNPL